ncbi:hypothetical protein NQ315_003652, partial [Exocentrus adspersus]
IQIITINNTEVQNNTAFRNVLQNHISTQNDEATSEKENSNVEAQSDSDSDSNFNPDDEDNEESEDDQENLNSDTEDYLNKTDIPQDKTVDRVEASRHETEKENIQQETSSNLKEDPQMKKSKLLVTREERAKNKYLRMRGKSYKGLKKDDEGKYKLINNVPPRSLGPTCMSKKCQKSKVFKCKLFNEKERQDMFKKFWGDLSWDMKRTYISSLVDTVPAKRKVQNSRRNETLIYTVKKGSEKIRVFETNLEYIVQMKISLLKHENEDV